MKKIIFCFFVVLSGYTHVFAQQTTKQITLEDIWQTYKFFPETKNDVVHMNDGEHYCMLENDIMINQYEYKTGEKTATIVRTSQLVPEGEKDGISIDEFEFSADETKILIATATEQIYRHSSVSDYYVYDLSTSKLTKLSSGGKQRLASFSPKGDQVAFVRDNNIFIKNLASGKETQVTSDGLYNNIINGATDWVYEEEFSFSRAWFWSPDGSKLAYYRFDESKVKEYDMVKYDSLYPTIYKYKYPKAGESNSVIGIFIYDVASGKSTSVDIGKETDIYIPRIKWTEDPSKLAVFRMNRLQNYLEILIADASTGTTKPVYTEKNKYYIDITDNLFFLGNKKQFIYSSEKDGYSHVYLLSLEGKPEVQLTKGKWDVTEVKGIDEKNKLVYFVSAEESPMDRALYSVKLDGTGKIKLSQKKGTNEPEFSKGFRYFINSYSDANTPFVVTINKANGKEIKNLVDNASLFSLMKDFGFTKKEFFKFKTSENIELNAWMIKPASFDSAKKYPVFMFVYGGPGVQTVENSWGYFDFSWAEMLAQKGYIVVSVDNRGTGARGEEFKKCTYLQLGKLETIDQIESAKYLGSLAYVDSKRIGIFGWSYGGYMSALCLTKGADYFKMGIAVAPVTNWRYYDNIYTERFMGLPKDNASGYDDNSPINHVKKLKGKFLLMHGTADDNVHFQNSMELVKSLVNANKQFETFFYPNKNHNISGGVTRFHLYKKMTDFILENL